MSDEPRPGEDIVAYGVRTGRFPRVRADYWRGAASADPDGTRRTILSLAALPEVAARIDAEATRRPVAAAVRVPAGDAFRLNPAVDNLRRDNPTIYRLASSEGPPPTMFGSGDFPRVTASGLDPALLATVPATARHALAAAPDLAAAYEIIERVTGDDGDFAAAQYAAHGGWGEYQSRVLAWARGPQFGLTREQAAAEADGLYRQMYPDRP